MRLKEYLSIVRGQNSGFEGYGLEEGLRVGAIWSAEMF